MDLSLLRSMLEVMSFRGIADRTVLCFAISWPGKSVAALLWCPTVTTPETEWPLVVLSSSSSFRTLWREERDVRTVRKREEIRLVSRLCQPQVNLAVVIAVRVSLSVTMTMSFLFGEVLLSHSSGFEMSLRNQG